MPVPDVDLLPELEELLAPDRLVPEPVRSDAPDLTPVPAPEPERAPEPEAKPLTRAELHAARARARTHRRGRHALVLACVLVAVVVLAGVLISQFRDTTPEVDLSVDGHRISVKTDAKTVGGLLEARKLNVDPAARVSPALGAKITDGLDIKLVRPRMIRVDHDGVVKPLKTTATTPAALLKQLKLDETSTATIGAARNLAAGGTIKLRTIKDAIINVDGASVAQRTPALTVAEFLQQNGVVLGPSDTVSPALDAPITDGVTVTVARITGDVETVEEDIAPPTQRQDDPNLTVGQEKVIHQGTPGRARITYQVTRRDGEVVERTPISNVPIKPPDPTIVAVGSMKALTPAAAGGGSRTGSASWYQSPFGDDSCATKEYIPKGTTIRVTNLTTGQSVMCRVADRVEAARVVDMDKEAFAQLAPNSSGVFPARVDW